MTIPARIRFLSFGCSSSRFTCASVSSPLIASTECPKAIMIPIKPMMLGALSTILYRSPSGVNHAKDLSQPSELSDPPEKLRFDGIGAGGKLPAPHE